jgi:serine/threonine-protein kinase
MGRLPVAGSDRFFHRRRGMGRVWKAEDPMLRRIVAIKFLPESLAQSAIARNRFLREARAMSNISHPGIAAVFDAGETDGELYIAMQLVEGCTVRERIRAGTLAPSDAVRIAHAAALALEHAHSRGVIHRDITSNNIMVRENGEVVIVDFGLARRAVDSTRLSRTGQLVGTVGFIAPRSSAVTMRRCR